MQSEHDIKKAELVRKLAELAQQVGGVEEKMRRTHDKETELHTEQERLALLKSASAQEMEEVLKRHESELNTSVKTAKMTLEGLNKYSTLLLGDHVVQHLNICCCCCLFG